MARKILLVDDEPLILKGLKYSLEQDGYLTDSAMDGEEALAKFFAGEYDLILLDVMLPGLDGWGVCRAIRAESQTPIIMLTAKSETEDKVNGLKQGADDYITKPFEMKEVLARIEAVLRRSGQRLTARRLSPELQRTIGVIYKQKTGLSTAGQLFLSELKASRIPPRG